MTNPAQNNNPPAGGESAARRPYVKPEIKRVDLALEETRSGSCKIWGSGDPECGDSFEPAESDGS